MYDLFYRNPRLVALSLLLILVAGLSSLMVLPRMEDPLLTPRAASISTIFPGADAQRVEALVTEKLEEELRDIQEIKETRSTSRAGVSFLQVELRDDVQESEAAGIWSRLRDKLEDAADQMPEGVGEPDFDQADVKAYALIVSLRWDHDSPPSYGILRRLAKQLQDQLETLPGTEKSEIYGDPGEEIQVELDPAALAAIGLTPEQIAQSLRSSDAKVAAGQLRNPAGDLLLEVSGELDTLTRIGDTPIRFGQQDEFVKLADIASIRKATPNPPSSLARVDGQTAVCVGVLVRADSRIDLWHEKAQQILADYSQQLPIGVHLHTVFQQNRYVEQRLHTLLGNLMLGGLAVLLVIWFMMGWRSALIVGSALPLSSLMVLAGLRWMEIPIHQMSVTGLIIALGLLIDNAIVMVDEVGQKIRQGVSPGQAVAATVKHLAIPLLGSTLTTALAFGPIALMPGPAGEFVGSIAISVIMAVFSSLILAMTIIPTLAAWGIDRRPSDHWSAVGFSNARMVEVYRRVLGFLFARPVAGIAVSLFLPLMGFAAASQLAEQFFPPADRDQIHVELELPANASLEQTQQLARRAEAVMQEDDSITEISWFFGESAPIFYYNLIPNRKNQVRYAQAIIQRDRVEGSRELINRLQSQLDQAFPESLFLVRQLEQGPPFYAPIEIRLFGPDMDVLQQLGQQVRLTLTQTPDVVHTRSEMAEVLPKLMIDVDPQQARLTGLDQVEIANQLNRSLDGSQGGSVLEATEELPVRLRVRDAARSDLNRLASLDLRRTNGNSDGLEYHGIPLSALGQLKLTPEISGIPRFNGQRMNEIQAFLPAGVLPSKVLNDFQQRLQESSFQLPPGYTLSYGGEASKRNDAIGNLMANVGILAVLMVATLVLSFQSFRMAALIGGVAFASVGLGMGSLWIFGYPFGFMAIIGTMGLIGIAINDSIVILAALEEDRRVATGDLQVMTEIVVRASRHIISTSLTTMAGFAPLVLSGGGFWPPLAVAISGGVGGATVLALIFVPSCYRLLRHAPSHNTLELARKLPTLPRLVRQRLRRCSPV